MARAGAGWLEQVGETVLVGAWAGVLFDPAFAAAIGTRPYQVFVTAYDPMALYVPVRRPDGFDIRVVPGTMPKSAIGATLRCGWRVVAAWSVESLGSAVAGGDPDPYSI